MHTNWTSIPHQKPGETRYKRQSPRAEAVITRQENTVCADMKTGLFGLGSRIHSCSFDTTQTDEVVLDRLDRVANPPAMDSWKEIKDQQAEGVTHYQGRETGGLIRSRIDAYITRVGDEAKVVAHGGLLGPHIEGHYFAPAPSDQEILRRISQP